PRDLAILKLGASCARVGLRTQAPFVHLEIVSVTLCPGATLKVNTAASKKSRDICRIRLKTRKRGPCAKADRSVTLTDVAPRPFERAEHLDVIAHEWLDWVNEQTHG